MMRDTSTRLLLGLLFAGGTARAQPVKPRLAALVLPTSPSDAALADNLTEVLIAQVARRGTHELVGAEEFRARLGVDASGALACLDNVSCLGRAGVALGVTEVLAGTVGTRGKDHLFNLNLHDVARGEVRARVFTLVSGDIPELIAAVQSATDKVFEPKVEPGAVRVASATPGASVYLDDAFVGTTPVRRDGVEPGRHRLRVEKDGHHGLARELDVPAGNLLDIQLSLESLPRKRRWPAYVGWGALAGGVLAAAGGVFFGVLSQETPSASTRADFLGEIDRKQTQATTANVLFAVAGGLAALSGATLYGFSDDIF